MKPDITEQFKLNIASITGEYPYITFLGKPDIELSDSLQQYFIKNNTDADEIIEILKRIVSSYFNNHCEYLTCKPDSTTKHKTRLKPTKAKDIINPDLSEMYVTKRYYGTNCEAKLMKSVGVIPANAGSNSRIAQVKRLKQFFNWIVDKCGNTPYAECTVIYESIQEREDNRRKYQSMIEAALLYKLLNCENETLITTVDKLLVEIGIISKQYKQNTKNDYTKLLLDDLNDKYNNSETNYSETKLFINNQITDSYNEFRSFASKKYRSIVITALDNLQLEKKINYFLDPVIVLKNGEIWKSINVINDCSPKQRDKYLKMILEAEDYAITNTKIKKDADYYCTTMEDVYKHNKYSEYKRHYQDYINTFYGWEYTYDALRIIGTTKQSIKMTICNKLLEYNSIMVEFFKNNTDTKFNNRMKKLNQQIELYKQAIEKESESIGLSASLFENDIIDYENQEALKNALFKEITDFIIDKEVKKA